MAKGYVVYNPLAGNGQAQADAQLLQVILDEELEYYDITRITNYEAFIGGMEREDYLVVVGGDGTLNRFVNDTDGLEISQEILYFPTGTGNDFAKDIGMGENPRPITEYLKNLPSVEVNGKHYRFINGVGFGIDGYCCQVGDELRKIPGKKVNYTGIAIKGLLLYFAPRNATVTVDGKEYTYKKVWIAPTMHGKFYGGGMIPTYLNLNSLGLLNTPWVMFVPAAISVTNFIIMRNYFTHSVPGELIEAAYMEGATELQTLTKIVLPLSKPILSVLSIYYMSGHWNAYFSAIIYLSDEKLMPLQVFLRRILIMGGMEGMSTGSTMTDSLIYESLKYGVIVVSTLPMLVGYLLVQKSFKKGIMMGSLKG